MSNALIRRCRRRCPCVGSEISSALARRCLVASATFHSKHFVAPPSTALSHHICTGSVGRAFFDSTAAARRQAQRFGLPLIRKNVTTPARLSRTRTQSIAMCVGLSSSSSLVRFPSKLVTLNSSNAFAFPRRTSRKLRTAESFAVIHCLTRSSGNPA